MLTQGSFLATHAKADQTSPTLRGKFVRAQLFCTPPPASAAVGHRERRRWSIRRKSTRERFAEHTTDPFCARCHKLMDPIGFAFENYDATGRWRDIDADQPVDATGALTGTDVDATLDGVPSLAKLLAASARGRHLRRHAVVPLRLRAERADRRRPVRDRRPGDRSDGRRRRLQGTGA